MLIAPRPADEINRQLALDELDLTDTPAEPYLDILVQLTRELFQVEGVIISLIDHERQWFKARVGVPLTETERDMSLCGHTLAAGKLLVLEDIRLDPRFVDHPAAGYFPFYAGVPLHARNRQPVGTLCLIHTQSRQLSNQDRANLQNLAMLAEGYLQMSSMSQQARRLRQEVDREQRKALLDPLTQLWNRAALDSFFSRERAASEDNGRRLGVVFCDLDNFKQVNDTFGHAGGDHLLWESARRMASALRPEDMLIRLGGEEFVALISVKDADELALIAERIRQAIAATPVIIGTRDHELTTSIGTALARFEDTQASLLARADSALYRAKQQGRDRVVNADLAQP
jgi:diguanylate cyclase (GGDEF)-like protein